MYPFCEQSLQNEKERLCVGPAAMMCVAVGGGRKSRTGPNAIGARTDGDFEAGNVIVNLSIVRRARPSLMGCDVRAIGAIFRQY